MANDHILVEKKKCENKGRCGYDAESGHEFCCGCLARQSGISYAAMRARLEEAKKTQPKVYRQFQEQPETVCPPQGETISEAKQRVKEAQLDNGIRNKTV